MRLLNPSSRFFVAALFSLTCTTAFSQATPEGYAALDRYVAPPVKSATPQWFAAPSGASLHETLKRWAAQAGWKHVVWQLPEDTDFTLGEARRFDGDIGQAAKALVTAIGPEANLQVNVDSASHVLIVQPAQ